MSPNHRRLASQRRLQLGSPHVSRRSRGEDGRGEEQEKQEGNDERWNTLRHAHATRLAVRGRDIDRSRPRFIRPPLLPSSPHPRRLRASAPARASLAAHPHSTVPRGRSRCRHRHSSQGGSGQRTHSETGNAKCDMRRIHTPPRPVVASPHTLVSMSLLALPQSPPAAVPSAAMPYHALTHVSGAILCLALAVILVFTHLSIRGLRAHRAAEAAAAARGTATTLWALGFSLPTLLRASSVACCFSALTCCTLALIANYLFVDLVRDYGLRYVSPIESPSGLGFSRAGQFCMFVAKLGPGGYAITKGFSYVFFFFKARLGMSQETQSRAQRTAVN